MSQPLWMTTPVGTLAKAMQAWAGARLESLKSHAEKAAEDFLYDLSADGPVLVVNGETHLVQQREGDPLVFWKGQPVWVIVVDRDGQ